MKILVDTSYLVSLFWHKDSNYKKANTIGTSISDKHELYVSHDILKETLTVLAQRIGKEQTRLIYDRIVRECSILSISDEIFHHALELFLSSKTPKDVSVIDCTSVILLSTYSLDAILTFDRHFRSMGVKVLPK